MRWGAVMWPGLLIDSTTVKKNLRLFILSGRPTPLYPGERRACVSMSDIQWHGGAFKCYWTKKQQGGKKKLKPAEISVLFCSWHLSSEVAYSYGNIKNKMWNTVSHVVSSVLFSSEGAWPHVGRQTLQYVIDFNLCFSSCSHVFSVSVI